MMLVLNIYRHHHPMGNKKAMSSILDILTIYHRRIAKNEITHNNVLFLYGVLYGCKVLNGFKSSIVINISIGTLVIIGLHIMLVTIANFSLEHTLGINGTLCYQWYTALPTAIVIVAILYPIISWSKRHFPIMLGRK